MTTLSKQDAPVSQEQALAALRFIEEIWEMAPDLPYTKVLRRFIYQAAQERQWIPVKKRLPEAGQTVLCYWPREDNGPLAGWQFATAQCWPGSVVEWHNPEDDEDDYAPPTYWQPLPAPPHQDHQEQTK